MVSPVVHGKDATNGASIIADTRSENVLRSTSRATYPNSTPPKATNMPMIMAGAAEPAASAGFFNITPMMKCEVCGPTKAVKGGVW